jgi:transposase
VHRSAPVRGWLAGREAEIEVFHLPPYSPELNPDEGVNADLKQVVTRETPARSKQRLKRAVIGHMRGLSKSPHRVRSFFGHETFRYAPLRRLVQDHPGRINRTVQEGGTGRPAGEAAHELLTRTSHQPPS